MFTPARYDGLPGWSFPAPGWSYPTKDEVADYLESYAARFRLPVRTGIRVDGLSRQDDAYVVTSGLTATSGQRGGGHRRLPDPADPGVRHLSSIRASCSSIRASTETHRSSSDGGVLVVGAGNSGAEIALESSVRHPTWPSGRDTGQELVRAGGLSDRLFTPPFWFLLSHVLTVRTPMGRKVRQQLSNRGLPLARVRRKDLVRRGSSGCPASPACATVCRGSQTVESSTSPT